MPLWAWLFFVLLIRYGAFVQWRAWDKRHCCSKAEFQVDSSARRLADLPTEQGPNNRVRWTSSRRIPRTLNVRFPPEVAVRDFDPFLRLASADDTLASLDCVIADPATSSLWCQ